ncbi:MAG: hypothetical protein V4687_08990 [Bacteroidota bacterium]
MKKLLFTFITCAALLTYSADTVSAQNYNTGLGLRIDAGDGFTGVGFNIKHFFTRNNAIDANLIFFDGDVVGLGAEYQYNAPVTGVKGLDWYLGIGPNFLFGNNATAVQIRPVAGLDLKVPGAPIDFAFDWRPMFTLNDNYDSVNAARFGISIRYAF